MQYSEKYIKALCVGMFVCVFALVCKFNTILLAVYFLLAFVDFPRGVIPSPFAFRQHYQGNSPMDRWEVRLEQGKDPFTHLRMTVLTPSTLTAFIGITSSYRGDMVSAPLQPEHLTAVIYDLALLPFFSQHFKPQHNHLQVRYCSLYLVCVAI